jgi:N-acetylglucosaminyldiphosphoundecaprenol N-acetyl-beta-D-mannosaminyltransferase
VSRSVPVASRGLLGLRVDATSYAHATGEVLRRAAAAKGGYVCISTVHMLMEAWDDPGYRAQVDGAFLVTPDGMPLVWGLRRLGVPEATRVYGPTLMPIVCAAAADEDVPVGFYGGSPAVVRAMIANLLRDIPHLRVAFVESPPFRAPTPEEDAGTLDAIAASGARILFVGLGCPKQERWMAEHEDRVSAVMLGVGAAFDFVAGEKSQAPAWIQRAGFEWLFRLFSEPGRLWRRYLHHNPRFVWHFARQLLARARGPRA